jgi:type II secretion system protein N
VTNSVRIARAAAFVSGAALLFVVFMYLLFPTAQIDRVIAATLAPQGLTVSPAVHKTLLPGLAWDNLALADSQGELLRCRRLQVRPLLLPLVMGKAVISSAAAIGGGQLDLVYTLNGTDAVTLSTDGINLSEIPFFKTILGATVAGDLWSRGTLLRSTSGLNGDLKLEIKQLAFSGVKLGAFPLPDVTGLKAQGMVRVTNGTSRLESFTLAGEGIYMRLSGDLPGGASAGVVPLSLTLEIMPKPEFLEKQKLVFMLLAKFMSSPGVYKVPIKGTLLKPQIL